MRWWLRAMEGVWWARVVLGALILLALGGVGTLFEARFGWLARVLGVAAAVAIGLAWVGLLRMVAVDRRARPCRFCGTVIIPPPDPEGVVRLNMNVELLEPPCPICGRCAANAEL